MKVKTDKKVFNVARQKKDALKPKSPRHPNRRKKRVQPITREEAEMILFGVNPKSPQLK